MKWAKVLFIALVIITITACFKGCENYKCYEYKTVYKYVDPYMIPMWIGDMMIMVPQGGYHTVNKICVKDNWDER